MGCANSKQFVEDENNKLRRPRRALSGSLRRLVSFSRRLDPTTVDEYATNDAVASTTFVPDTEPSLIKNGSRARLILLNDETAGVQPPVLLDNEEKGMPRNIGASKRSVGGSGRHHRSGAYGKVNEAGDTDTKIVGIKNLEPKMSILDVPNGIEGEHVAAGWPRWLTAVAGEAVRGWLPRKSDSFERLDKIGQGTYSSVYKARDLDNGKIVALKKVRFANMDPESVRFMAREIHILRSLDHPNIIKLEGLVTSRMSSSLYLVFEYMEHDLAGLAATQGMKFTEPQVKCYMQQLFSGLDHCHKNKVLHRDIKGANLLLDNNGILKIADFGLATFFNPHQKQQLTSRVVTLWYRPPELLLGATDYGAAVDLWSAGCILAELLSGKPIMPGRTEVEQLHKIFKLCGSPSEDFWADLKLSRAAIFKPQQPYKRIVNEIFKDLTPSAMALLDQLLAVEPANRGTAASALKSNFFTTRPYACDPSSLPKYPPSKEYDAKLRDEEARRQRTVVAKEPDSDSTKSKPLPVLDVGADLQQRQLQANPKCSGSKFSVKEDGLTGFTVDPPARTRESNLPQRVPHMHPGRSSSNLGRSNGADQRMQRTHLLHGNAADLANFSITSGPRGNVARLGNLGEATRHSREQRPSLRYNQSGNIEASGYPDWSSQPSQRPSTSHLKDDAVGTKEPAVNGTKKNRIHFSGPLMPPGGNVEEMLKEHDRQIEQVVRKARIDKTKGKHQGEKDQSEALLYSNKSSNRSDH